MQKLFLLLLFMLSLFMLTHKEVDASTRCIQLKGYIRKAHYQYFGIDFPYHYSIGQSEAESNCRHNVFSSDRVGSEGFAQITFSIWKSALASQGINEIKSISNHARAQAYINFLNYKASKCKKLFEMYQRYNGGALVTKELIIANSCRWEDGYKVCKRKDICVRYKGNKCVQYRNACDINYQYSKEIYNKGRQYLTIEQKIYNFW